MLTRLARGVARRVPRTTNGDGDQELRDAEDRVAALDALGPAEGAGATIWARVIPDELALHNAARERFRTNTADREAWERLHGSGLVLVVAIAQVLAFEKRVRSLTGDAELFRARKAFDAAGPRARAIRDVAAHLDDYAVGQGDRQTSDRLPHEPRVTERHVRPLIFWTDDTYLQLGGDRLSLHAAARAAIALAEVVERVRFSHFRLAGERADAALRRRYPLD